MYQKLKRDKQDIIENGLTGYYFTGEVVLTYEDGSYIYYRRLFTVNNTDKIAVFAKYCGYHTYNVKDF